MHQSSLRQRRRSCQLANLASSLAAGEGPPAEQAGHAAAIELGGTGQGPDHRWNFQFEEKRQLSSKVMGESLAAKKILRLSVLRHVSSLPAQTRLNVGLPVCWSYETEQYS